MITEITLKNFKCFKEKTHFPLSKINLLTGVNGGGKSSMLQALLLFEQSKDVKKIYLNGDCVELGMLEDLKNSENPIGMQKSSGRSRFE
jgi:AAA15 family ATPase/GTPase